ncbi:UDP-4-amino-4,6-dideoxy-N-acetyl-beta-L-altrosamine transaminase [Candidatus Pacearchaeota archaeon CG10_big_fil_rev_8_21_14_0_10_32_42]|nr:MAG: UDP-4-amino-4,6-dideoxy-N-acetyl-beta-L-altrosamine transaminase [Candidatus Pacearchaeota archaeon CG10_big_fil_rev_8_21_14_0_10_32_42]
MNIGYGKQTIGKDDLNEVERVLGSGFLTCGPEVKNFEDKFSKEVGSKYAVAVSSGTAALHLACIALGLREGDELITSPMTFAASANCALYCGAKPVFIDVDEKTGLIDENKIEEKISEKTKIIIPVHYGGMPCNLEKIKSLADKYNLRIVEDACHALGAEYKKSKIGDCFYSDMAVFSFHPVKHITTGEGGMITTNSKELYEKLLRLRSHGIEKKEDWKQEMVELGYNYRITDFQCALGSNQLNNLKNFISKRREIAKKYDEELGIESKLELIKEKENLFNPYHLYVIKLQNSELRKRLYDFLKEKGIFCQVHYIPVYLHPYYQSLGYKKGLCSSAENFYEKILSIPVYPLLKEEEQTFVIEKIKEFLKNN